MRYARYLLLVLMPLLAACGGGSNSVTLHGTFTDTTAILAPNEPLSSCTAWEGSFGRVMSITADSIPAGTASFTWHGKPATVGNQNGYAIDSCKGTWSVTVGHAQISYVLSISNITGSVTIPAPSAGNAIALNDGDGIDALALTS